MKAIVRNVLLACLISTFALFGAIARKPLSGQIKTVVPIAKQTTSLITESHMETFTCLGIAFSAWVLCFWRCAVIYRRLNEEREYQRRFNEYMRNSSLQRHY